MNFYDVYTTLSINPETQPQLVKISEYLGCQNQLESMKEALFKKPNRAQFPGAFPFDEETGKIYDTLWKAADAENYTTAGKVGRWLMKLICPPADDEGMAAFHKKASNSVEPDLQPEPETANYAPNPYSSTSAVGNTSAPELDVVQADNQKWEMSDDDDNVIVVEAKPKQQNNDVVKRSNKKGD
ncbi:hypothetical protein TRFO_21885 [Tritrichomonas foetus]|uniref:Uncharacterized protein n=1 Tax=Tritrichomonas foetus TaxID=1144522 RepID=A0A1J4KHE3_9EUKA|nr:hypothetical protein TRFO_21885 [Tritrichomonas foetus]|eukprot:OHT09244.1 hypothetical protein TRFO_21885 [Tritrichomonas foetus]